MTPEEQRERARQLRADARALIEEAQKLEDAAEHAISPHCANCGHTLSEHADEEDDPKRSCRYFDLSHTCRCTRYKRSKTPIRTYKDNRR